MSTASTEFDLFDEAPGYRQSPRSRPKKLQGGSPTLDETWDAEAAAKRLEDSGNYRVLRKLVPRPLVSHTESVLPRLAVLVDTETTGLQHARHEVIEIGAVAFTYDDEGKCRLPPKRKNAPVRVKLST